MRAKNSFDLFAEYSPLPSAQIQQRIKLLSDGSTWIFQAKFGNNVMGSGFIPSYEELENYFTPSQSKFLRGRKEIWLWNSSNILTGEVDENKMKCHLSGYLIFCTFYLQHSKIFLIKILSKKFMATEFLRNFNWNSKRNFAHKIAGWGMEFLLNRISSRTLSGDHLSSFSSTNVQAYDEISTIPTSEYQQMTSHLWLFSWSAALRFVEISLDGHNIVLKSYTCKV